MKWSSYKASNITPQMTLLEKLNAILKYLDNEQKLYVHNLKCSGVTLGSTVNVFIKLINTYDDKFSSFDKLVENFNSGNCIKASYLNSDEKYLEILQFYQPEGVLITSIVITDTTKSKGINVIPFESITILEEEVEEL